MKKLKSFETPSFVCIFSMQSLLGMELALKERGVLNTTTKHSLVVAHLICRLIKVIE
jgi:hypothetical protein